MAKQTDLLPADIPGRLAFWPNGPRDGDGLRPCGFDDRDLVDTAIICSRASIYPGRAPMADAIK